MVTRRTKITAYIPSDLGDTLKRLAAIKDRSVSDVVEDAIAKGLLPLKREAEHAALMALLTQIQRRLAVIERSQETLFEMSAHAARFQMSSTPDIPDADRPSFNIRGAERFRAMLDVIISRLALGKGVLRNLDLPFDASTAQAPQDTAANDSSVSQLQGAAHD